MRWLVVAVWLLAGCGGAAPKGETRRDAVLVLEVGYKDASIWVDGRFVAEVGQARGGVAVSPGAHRVEVRRDGYHTFYALVTVGPGERRAIAVELAEELP